MSACFAMFSKDNSCSFEPSRLPETTSSDLADSVRSSRAEYFKSCLHVTAADIGKAKDATPADFRQLTAVDRGLVVKLFGKGRLYRKRKELSSGRIS